MTKNAVVNLDGNIPSVRRNQNKVVYIAVESDEFDIDSQESQQHTIRRSKRVNKSVERLHANQVFAENETIGVEYSRKRDFAQMLFNQVFPTYFFVVICDVVYNMLKHFQVFWKGFVYFMYCNFYGCYPANIGAHF